LHCCRGDSQNLDLSKNIIDSFIDKNVIYLINTLKFSGGEPTLNGEALEYLVNRLIEKQIIVRSFMMSINGLSYSKELVNALNRLNQYCGRFAETPGEQYGSLFVSQTQYHKKASQEVIDKFSQLPYFAVPRGIQKIEPEDLLPYGNAVKNKLTTNQPNIAEIMDYDKDINIVEYQGETFLVFASQYISSNGNVLNNGCMSYDMMDKYHIGNVTEKSMIEMYSEQPKMLGLAIKK
jgi:sulfatase maturation enzyme AslB (radical SAM superfamily)